jgi:hypothetical protein
MQETAFDQAAQTVPLYRVCYRCKETGAIGKASDVDCFEDAQKRVYEFNIRYADTFEYFAEPVNPKSLPQNQLIKLFSEGKLPLRYLPSSN